MLPSSGRCIDLLLCSELSLLRERQEQVGQGDPETLSRCAHRPGGHPDRPEGELGSRPQPQVQGASDCVSLGRRQAGVTYQGQHLRGVLLAEAAQREERV